MKSFYQAVVFIIVSALVSPVGTLAAPFWDNDSRGESALTPADPVPEANRVLDPDHDQSPGHAPPFSKNKIEKLKNVGVNQEENRLILKKGGWRPANPNDLTIPNTQNVSVTFLFEGAGYRSHFGWFATKYVKDPRTELDPPQNLEDFIPLHIYQPETGTLETRYYIDPDMMDRRNNRYGSLGPDGIPDDPLFNDPNIKDSTSRAEEVTRRLLGTAKYPSDHPLFPGMPKNPYYMLFRSIEDDEGSSTAGGNGILDHYRNRDASPLMNALKHSQTSGESAKGLKATGRPPEGDDLWSTESELAEYLDTIALTDPDNGTSQIIYLGAASQDNLVHQGHFVIDGDGKLTGKDMRKNLGLIQGGTEIVFFLTSNGEFDKTFYSKKHFNGDTWQTNRTIYQGAPENCQQGHTQCDDCRQVPIDKLYYVGRAMPNNQSVRMRGCWLTADALTRLNNLFGINFGSDETETIRIHWNSETPWASPEFTGDMFFQHMIQVASADNPHLWVLGWEDMYNGGDTDHNDMIFVVNGGTSGRVESTSLSETQPHRQAEDGTVSTIATINMAVEDKVPKHTQITYYGTIDNGESWFPLAQSTPEPNPMDQKAWLGWSDLKSWRGVVRTPDRSRHHNTRSLSIKMDDLGFTGNQLRWRAEMSTEDAAFSPEIYDVRIEFTTVLTQAPPQPANKKALDQEDDASPIGTKVAHRESKSSTGAAVGNPLFTAALPHRQPPTNLGAAPVTDKAGIPAQANQMLALAPPALPTLPQSQAATSPDLETLQEFNSPPPTRSTDFPQQQQFGTNSNTGYLIGQGDVLEIIVWRNEQLSHQVVVMPDGKISLPLIQDVQAEGMAVPQLKDMITEKLTAFIDHPKVSVIVNQINSCKVSVLGRVVNPGVYPVLGKTTLIEAISMAGGFTEWANRRRIAVITQQDGREAKITVNYKKIVSGDDPSQNIILQRGDTIIVP